MDWLKKYTITAEKKINSYTIYINKYDMYITCNIKNIDKFLRDINGGIAPTDFTKIVDEDERVYMIQVCKINQLEYHQNKDNYYKRWRYQSEVSKDVHRLVNEGWENIKLNGELL